MEFSENSQPIRPFQFSSARQQRIYTKLQLLGSGPAAFYFDACRLMELEPPLISTTHIVSHLLREIESALRAVVIAASGEKVNSESQAKYRETIKIVLNFLEIPIDSPVGKLWLSLPDTNGALHTRAHRDALAYRPNSLEFKAFWEDMEIIFDAVLKRFEEKYLSAHQLIDELLNKSDPTEGDVKRLRNEVPNSPPALQDFFSKADVKWLPLLRPYFFKLPPRIDPVKNGFIPWSESQFLVRVAKSDSQSVLEIILRCPETDNPYVLDDICEIALELPIELAIEMIPKIKNALVSTYQRMLPIKVAEFINRLIKHHHITNALDLSRDLLAILPEPEISASNRRRIQAKYQPYFYKEVLEEYIWELATIVPVDFAILLGDLLSQGIQSLVKGDVSPTDPSRWWALFQQHHHSEDIDETLISALYKASVNAAQIEQSDLITIIEVWEKYPWAIFRRMTLFLLSAYPLSSRSLVSSYLTNRDFFDDFSNEYYLLLKNGFAQLGSSEQETILRWIDNPIGDHPDHWELYWLTAIQNDLPVHWLARFEQLIKVHGEPKQFTYHAPIETTSWWGNGSPKPSNELLSMNFNDLFTYLKDWQPKDEFGRITQDGLAEQLKIAVANSPRQFALNASGFADVSNLYTNYFLSGLRDASANKLDFAWSPVLEFCSHIMQNIHLETISGNLSWTRAEISDLLKSGFDNDVIAYEHRQSAWSIIELLVKKSPNSDDEYSNTPHNLSPSEVSYNTYRGRALHTVIRYLFWVQRHLRQSSDNTAEFEMTFDRIPEVKNLLEQHLSDNLISVKAIFGQYLPWLDVLNKDWLQQNLEQIFVGDDGLWYAAWNAYVTNNDPYNRNLTVLEKQYVRAINSIGELQGLRVTNRVSQTVKYLTWHLMAFYERGLLKLGESQGLLTLFYQFASDELCAYALKSVGESLENITYIIPEEIFTRITSLWEYRFAQIRSTPQSHSAELLAFGWWFISNKLDPIWSINQLNEVLILTPNQQIDAADQIVSQMANMANSYGENLIDCLDLITEHTQELWQIDLWKDEIRTILLTSLKSTSSSAKQKSAAYINKLAARGYMHFRDLLDS